MNVCKVCKDPARKLLNAENRIFYCIWVQWFFHCPSLISPWGEIFGVFSLKTTEICCFTGVALLYHIRPILAWEECCTNASWLILRVPIIQFLPTKVVSCSLTFPFWLLASLVYVQQVGIHVGIMPTASLSSSGKKNGSVHDFLIGCSLALAPPWTSFMWDIGEQSATTASHASPCSQFHLFFSWFLHLPTAVGTETQQPCLEQ